MGTAGFDKFIGDRFRFQPGVKDPHPTKASPNNIQQEPVIDPNDVIDTIVDAIDYAEITRDAQGLVKARRLLNNELRQVIDDYIQVEVGNALRRKKPSARFPFSLRRSKEPHDQQT